jgi:hypothetical protein
MGRTSDARERLMEAANDLIWEYSYRAVSDVDVPISDSGMGGAEKSRFELRRRDIDSPRQHGVKEARKMFEIGRARVVQFRTGRPVKKRQNIEPTR